MSKQNNILKYDDTYAETATLFWKCKILSKFWCI